MATKSQNCPTAQKKLTREKPVTPPPAPVPVFAEVPCPRDQRAYSLYLDQHSQRWIADKLKCAQPTVLRGIRRMEKWLATTLPEDRGEFTATEKLRLALAKHERLMERLLKMSLREFRRSRKTIPMKKTITMKDGVDDQGEPVKIRIEEWNKPQIGRKGFIDAAAKASHEITVLAAGWLGPGSGSISMAEVMDPEERDRWDRLVTIRDAQIRKLEESGSAEAETPDVLGAGLPTPPTGLTAGLPAGGTGEEAGDLRSDVSAGPATRAEQSERPAQRPAPPVSEVAEKEPVVNQETGDQRVTTSSRPMACAIPSNSSSRKTSTRATCITDRPRMNNEPVCSRKHVEGPQ